MHRPALTATGVVVAYLTIVAGVLLSSTVGHADPMTVASPRPAPGPIDMYPSTMASSPSSPYCPAIPPTPGTHRRAGGLVDLRDDRSQTGRDGKAQLWQSTDRMPVIRINPVTGRLAMRFRIRAHQGGCLVAAPAGGPLSVGDYAITDTWWSDRPARPDGPLRFPS